MEKNQKKKRQLNGLGDLIEIFTHFFFINRIVDYFTKLFGKEDCGCTRRKDKLNKAFPLKRK